MKRVREMGVLLAAAWAISATFGGTPELSVEYRRSVATNEVLEAVVRQLATTSAVPVSVSLNWKDGRGTTRAMTPAQTLGTNVGDRVVFEVPAAELYAGRVVYPQLVVSGAGARQVFAYGFWPVDIRTEVPDDRSWVVQELMNMSPERPVTLAISPVRDTEKLLVTASVGPGDRLKKIEVFADLSLVYSNDVSQTDYSFEFKPRKRGAVYRVRYSDVSGRTGCGPAVY